VIKEKRMIAHLYKQKTERLFCILCFEVEFNYAEVNRKLERADDSALSLNLISKNLL
jgi:hypothetical protein